MGHTQSRCMALLIRLLWSAGTRSRKKNMRRGEYGNGTGHTEQNLERNQSRQIDNRLLKLNRVGANETIHVSRHCEESPTPPKKEAWRRTGLIARRPSRGTRMILLHKMYSLLNDPRLCCTCGTRAAEQMKVLASKRPFAIACAPSATRWERRDGISPSIHPPQMENAHMTSAYERVWHPYVQNFQRNANDSCTCCP